MPQRAQSISDPKADRGQRIRGGTGAISNAIAEAAREAGVEIRTKSGIAQILIKNGRAIGVALENGDEIQNGRGVGMGLLRVVSKRSIHPAHFIALREQ